MWMLHDVLIKRAQSVPALRMFMWMLHDMLLKRAKKPRSILVLRMFICECYMISYGKELDLNKFS
jgi:hypothetical protein